MKNEQIAIIGAAGLGLLYLITRKAETGGYTLPQQQTGQGSGAVGKLLDSYTPRGGGRVDDFWGNLKPSKRLLGREVTPQPYFVDPEKAVNYFGLKGIEFGNWMNQQERLDFMFATLVTMSDMARVMNVAANKMGLKQKLQLAFGARGNGGAAAAFYSPFFYLINLTKTNGQYSFAHEFGHALDADLHLRIYGKDGMISGGSSTSRQVYPEAFDKNSVEYLFEKVFECLYVNPNGSHTMFYKEQGKRTDYYRMRAEVWARTFEKYIQIKFKDLGIINRWATIADEEQPPKDLVLKAEPWIRKIVRRAFK